METFVHLPGYDFVGSFFAIRFGDFKKNYLHYITCFNLSKFYRSMEKRIVKNLKTGKYVEETFNLIEEIGGRSEKILKLGTLLKAFHSLDQVKYESRIVDSFVLQMFCVDFNMKNKYPVEYLLYKKFNEKYLDMEDVMSLKSKADTLFFKALAYASIKSTIHKLEKASGFFPFLEHSQIADLNERLEYSLEHFHLTSRST